jgi:hypothetical protein
MMDEGTEGTEGTREAWLKVDDVEGSRVEQGRSRESHPAGSSLIITCSVRSDSGDGDGSLSALESRVGSWAISSV